MFRGAPWRESVCGRAGWADEVTRFQKGMQGLGQQVVSAHLEVVHIEKQVARRCALCQRRLE